MYNDLKDLYEHYFKLKFDKALIANLKLFRISWAQKDDEYIEFLGGNTLGTQSIRFSIKDDEGLIVDTLNMDINMLSYDITNTKGITKGRAAETNVIYQTLVYLMYGFASNKSLSTKDKEEALRECYYIFAYKKFSSLMFHYFKFPTDESIAKAVYEKLSNKFLIKKLGSWQKVFEYRAKDLLPGNIHFSRLQNYDTSEAIRVILDLQTKLNDMFKNIYAVTIDVTNNNERVVSDSLITKIQDEEGIKDVTNNPDKYNRYILSIIHSPNDYAKFDLANLICSQSVKITTQLFYNFLLKITELPNSTLTTIANVSSIKSIEALTAKGITKDYNKHILQVIDITKIKFTNLKGADRDIEKIKKLLEKEFIKFAPKSKYVAGLVSMSVLVYTFVRCLYHAD